MARKNGIKGSMARNTLVKTGLFAGLVLCCGGMASPQVASQQSAPPAKTQIKTIYVVPSSHWDLGFIAPPEEVLPRLKPHLDEVIANAKADPEFRWTIESAWQLREWLAHTTDHKQVQEFVDLVNKGQIQLSAVYGSMHTEFMGAEALNRIAYDMKAIEKQLGVKTDFAIMDDVPGFTSRLPQVLARSGVKYFVNGSNLFLFGGTSLTPGKMPFYWTAPDGSRVLTWQTQGHLGGYTEAMADYYLDPDSLEPYTKEHFYPKELEGKSRLEIMQNGVDKLLAKYKDANYPYDALMLLYLHDFVSSNREAKQLLPGIREWNAAGKEPKIVVATPAEFFRHMETTYGKDSFPAFSGDYSGLWSEVKINSPVISANARWIQDHLPIAEAIWSLLTFRNFTSLPSGNLEDTRLKLYKYDEHSGAAQVGWPKLMTRAEVDLQNREYANYTSTGRDDVQYLLDSGLQTLFAQKESKSETLVVFNPLSWTRTDVATIKLHAGHKIAGLKDLAAGTPVPVQTISDTEVAFLAKDVPPFGYRSYSIVAGTPTAPQIVAAPSPSLENSAYKLALRPVDGALTSLLDKKLNQELVDSTAGKAANSLLHWIPAENLPTAWPDVRITKESGPVFSRLTVRRPGTFWPETQVLLAEGISKVRIQNSLDRDKMPFVASNQAGEYYSFQFPAPFKGSASIWVEDGIGFHQIPEDYLPGARTDAAAPLHSLVMTGQLGGRETSITLSQKESFFVYLPGLPGVKGPNTFLNSARPTVMRKQDQGDTRDLGMVNFSTVEPGLPAVSTYAFSLRANRGSLDGVASYRDGWEENVPLIATQLDNSMAPATGTGSFFSFSAENVALLAFKPSADGNPEHYILRLQEIAGKPAEAKIATTLKVAAASVVSMTEDEELATASAQPLSFHLKPHETLTIRLTIPHPHKERSARWWEW
jgi:Glycosyl hydrolases family 38 N-terminal domain/Glycosyl hydrolases family 38 C-terminal beta sandwich domain